MTALLLLVPLIEVPLEKSRQAKFEFRRTYMQLSCVLRLVMAFDTWFSLPIVSYDIVKSHVLFIAWSFSGIPIHGLRKRFLDREEWTHVTHYLCCISSHIRVTSLGRFDPTPPFTSSYYGLISRPFFHPLFHAAFWMSIPLDKGEESLSFQLYDTLMPQSLEFFWLDSICSCPSSFSVLRRWTCRSTRERSNMGRIRKDSLRSHVGMGLTAFESRSFYHYVHISWCQGLYHQG